MTYLMPHNCQIKNLSAIYETYFPKGYKGTFVDVGAYNGYDFSNTWGLAREGWKGILIEPVFDQFKELDKTYQKMEGEISLFNCAVSNFCGEVSLQLAGTLTSGSRDTISRMRKLDWAKGYITDNVEKVECYTLDSLLNIFNDPIPPIIDVLSIDVEGMEKEVCEGFNLLHWRPKLVIIELHEKDADMVNPDLDWFESYFNKGGYQKIYSDEINNIYVRS